MLNNCDNKRNLLLDEIDNQFSENLSLNFHHSLEDCDYMDTYRNFPEDGETWMGPHNEAIKSEIFSHFTGAYGDSLISYQFEHQILLKKEYTWRDVNPEYMHNHYCGLYHLEQRGYMFYLAAWMHLHLSGYSSQLDLAINHFIECFKNPNDKMPCHDILINKALSPDKLNLMSKFFLYIKECGEDEYESERAAKNLKNGWALYLNDF